VIRRYLGLLGERDFRRLWLAQSVSEVGSEVTSLALPLVAVLVVQASPFEVAALGAVQFVARMILALPAGVWVDRVPRKRVLVGADLGRALVLLAIPIAAVSGLVSMWLLYVVAFLAAALTVFFDIGYQAILPDLVARPRLAEGNSRLEISNSAGQIVGPGLGGWLVGALSAPIAIVVDAVSFVVSAGFLAGIRGRAAGAGHSPPGPRLGLRREIGEGLAFYRRSPLLRALAVSGVVQNVGIWFAGSTLVVYLVRDLAMSPEQIGLGFSIGAVGVLLGAATASTTGTRFGIGPTIALSMAVLPLSWMLMALAEPSTALLILALFGIGNGLSSMTGAVNSVSLRQAMTPPELQGRVNATGRWLSWTAIPFGALAGGAVATVIGIRVTIVIGTAFALLAVPLLLVSPLRSVRSIPTPDPARVGA
jgi:MFS family permease